jgi:Derlin-2/3
MAAAFQGGGAEFPLETWFYELPLITRYWTTLTVLVSILVQCQILTPYQLFFSPRAVFLKSQYWRLLTTFLYFGPLNLDLLFHVFFLQRYSRLLEESSGRASPARFAWLLLYATTSLVVLSPLVSLPFLGSPLSSTLVYIWSRRNPETRLSLLGLMTFTAPWLPWVLMGFSLVMHGEVPKDEIMGVVVGHGEFAPPGGVSRVTVRGRHEVANRKVGCLVWYFFSDVYPSLFNGSRPLDPPGWWIRLFEGRRAPETGDEVEGDEDAPTGAAVGINHDFAAAAAPDVR